MGLVELENPMEMHPRFWPRTQMLSFIFIRVPPRVKRQKERREERGWEQTSQYYSSSPGGFSENQTQKWGMRGGNRLGRSDLFCFLPMLFDRLPQ